MVWPLATDREEGSLPLSPLRVITIVGMVSVQVAGYACGWRLVAYGSDGRRAQSKPLSGSFTLPLPIESERTTVGRNRADLWKPAVLPSLRHRPGHWRSHASTAAAGGRMFAEHGEGGGGQLWAAEVRPGLQRGRWWMRSSADPAAVAAVSADAGCSESRSGSASRSDSLIEFGKTNVALLPLLILTAIDRQRRAELRAERHCGGWFLDRLELGVDRRGGVG